MNLLDEVKEKSLKIHDRQILLLGDAEEKTAAVIGMGGLGSQVAEMLVRSGVSLKIFDDDKVSLSNLHRQTLYSENDIGKSKVAVAMEQLKAINPDAKITGYTDRMEQKYLKLLDTDIVLDCSDNLLTSFLLNSHCVENKKPLVFATVAADRGFVKIIDKNSACLSCFYKAPKDSETSDNVGVLGTAVQMAASLQTILAMKILTKKPYTTDLIRFNAWKPELKTIKTPRSSKCEVCR